MKYKTRSSLISIPWFENMMEEFLNTYHDPLGDLQKTRFVKERVARFHKDCSYLEGEELEKCMLARQQKIIDLYLSIKKGYKSGNLYLVSFNEKGEPDLFDGFHRLAILKYLKRDVEIEIETNWTGMSPPDPPPTGKDFPLVDVLTKEHPQGRWLYHPVNDQRLAGFKVARTDSQARLNFIAPRLVGKTVLEIGCSEGYFSRELTKRGYQVIAIDKSPGYIAACKYLALINGLKIDYLNLPWQEYLQNNCYFDNILFLSVLHNDMKFMPVDEALMHLPLFQNKCYRVFFEVPNNTNEQDWSADKYDFMNQDNITFIAQAMGMQQKETTTIWRPLHIFDKEAPMGEISNREWEGHNEWERRWWGDCKDTFDEQLKQETYARLMKLDQYAIHRRGFNLQNKSIIDIGGGPVSILLRCYNYRRAVIVDPCEYPQWVLDRYKIANIEYIKEKAEDVNFGQERFDEAWLYNCLQHVQNPAAVIEMAKASARKIRVAEVLNIGVYPGHPQSLNEQILNELFEREGLVKELIEDAQGLFYYGVFSYEK